MNLQRYLARVAYNGDHRPSLSTLHGLHLAHVLSVPFENLDVQLDRPLFIDIDAAYEKIVVNGRGGWCYEHNGLFGRALTELGFEVTRIAAGVMRQHKGENSAASHLCLLVGWPGSATRYLVDVGFGGSLIRPLPLQEGQDNQPPFKVGLRKLKDGHWQFWEDMGDGEFAYDFLDKPANELALAAKCQDLQSNPASNFVLNLVAQKRSAERHKILRGRRFTIASGNGIESTMIDSADELVRVLAAEFGLKVEGVIDLWPRVVARHNALFGDSTD